MFLQQLVIAPRTGDQYGEGTSLRNLGLAYATLGETRRAIEALGEAPVISEFEAIESPRQMRATIARLTNERRRLREKAGCHCGREADELETETWADT
jgi:hypothetical protein